MVNSLPNFTVTTQYSYSGDGVQNTMTWSTPSDINNVDKFVYIGYYSNGIEININNIDKNETTFTTGFGMYPNTDYYVNIRQYNKDNTNSEDKNKRAIRTLAITAPNAPSNVSISVPKTSNSITANITTNGDNGSAITHYFYSINGGNYTGEIAYANSFTFTAANPATYGVTYYINVILKNAIGNSGGTDSNTVTTYTDPSVPTGLTLASGNGKLTVTFGAPSNNGGYGIIRYEYRATYTGGSIPASGYSLINLPGGDITGLTNGTSYTVFLRAVSGSGTAVKGVSADTSATKTPYTVPSTPTASASGGNATITVTFSTASNNGSTITAYRLCIGITNPPDTSATAVAAGNFTNVYRSGDFPVSGTYTHDLTQHNGASLTNRLYYILVQAYNDATYSGDVVTSATPYTVPGPPGTDTTYIDYTNNNSKIFSNFSAAENNGSTILRYEYKFDSASITTYWVTASINPKYYPETTIFWYFESTFTPTPTQYGPTYKIKLRAVNEAGSGEEVFFRVGSVDKTFTPYIAPAAPTSVSLAVTNNSTTITVTVVQGGNNGSNVDGYYYNVNSVGYSNFIAYAGAPTTFTFTVNTGIVFGTSYSIKVIVRNAAGDSGETASTASVTPIAKPSAPASLVLTAYFGRVTYTIGTAPANGSNIIRYEYKVGSGSYINIGTTLTGTIYNLQTGTTYTIYTRAVNALGDGTDRSENIVIPAQSVSIIPTKNYFLYNGNSLDTVYKLRPDFGGTDIKYTNNSVDIGKRYVSGTTSTYYKYQSNNQFTPTSITNTPLPVDKLSVTTKNAILSSINATASTTIPTALPGTALIPAAVYGCKLLFSSYTGPVMTIRSSINNVTGNFYADSTGTFIGSAYLGTGTSLLEWLAGGIPYVQIWWDQTGNGSHACQFTLASQPTFNTNGYIDFAGSVYFDLPNSTLPLTSYSYVFKYTISPTYPNYGPNGPVIYGGNNNVSQYMRITLSNQFGTGYLIDHNSNYAYTGENSRSGNNIPISVIYDSTIPGVLNIYKSSTALSTTKVNFGTRSQGTGNNTIGKDVSSYFYSGLYYMYIIPLAISDTDRGYLETTPTPSNVIDSLSSATRNSMIKTTTTLSAGAYGVKLLYSAYTGPVFKLRKGSNNDEKDFYADMFGNLGDTHVEGRTPTGSNVFNWAHPSGVFVTTWYDQTGNANHATQTNAANQPLYDIYGIQLITFPGTTFFNLPDGTHPFNNTNYTYVFKCSIGNTINGNGGVFFGGSGSSSRSNAFRRDANFGYRNYWFDNDITPTNINPYLDNSVISLIYNGNTRYMFQNNALIVSAASSNRDQPNISNVIGKSIGDEYMGGGYIQYMYIIPLVVSEIDRRILENT